MTPTTVPEVLERAATILEDRGWYQGDFYPPGADERTAPVCAGAAIHVALGLHPLGDVKLSPTLVWDAGQYLADYVGYVDVGDWNDRPERTRGEVLATLRAAAKEARDER